MPTVSQALEQAGARLAASSDTPRLDAEILLCHVLGKTRAYLYTWPDKALAESESTAFSALVERRLAGEPVAHLTGRREFWSLSLQVSPDTLIPRPETELLVEQALQRIPDDAAWTIADLGTGSGAIALALASERPACRVIAVERSGAAIQVAQSNAETLGIDNIEFRQGSWFEPLAGEKLSLIVSNPPYIASEDPHLRQGDVRFEPMTALASGHDGLDDIRYIIRAAASHLQPGGWLLLEHGYDQAGVVTALLRDAGYVEVTDYADLQGHGRVAEGRWPGLD